MSKCIYDYADGILKWPLATLFLLDFHLTWTWHENELRGDTATNISGGLAKYLAWLGGLIKKWHR